MCNYHHDARPLSALDFTRGSAEVRVWGGGNGPTVAMTTGVVTGYSLAAIATSGEP